MIICLYRLLRSKVIRLIYVVDNFLSVEMEVNVSSFIVKFVSVFQTKVGISKIERAVAPNCDKAPTTRGRCMWNT